MNYPRLLLAALGATVTWMAIGFAAFALIPQMAKEYSKYSGTVYRTREGQMAAMPVGMAAMVVSIFILSLLYAMIYRTGFGAMEGTQFGVLIGAFAVCAFVLHNFANLNIGWVITAQQAVAYFVQWTVVGLVLGLIYRPG